MKDRKKLDEKLLTRHGKKFGNRNPMKSFQQHSDMKYVLC